MGQHGAHLCGCLIQEEHARRTAPAVAVLARARHRLGSRHLAHGTRCPRRLRSRSTGEGIHPALQALFQALPLDGFLGGRSGSRSRGAVDARGRRVSSAACLCCGWLGGRATGSAWPVVETAQLELASAVGGVVEAGWAGGWRQVDASAKG